MTNKKFKLAATAMALTACVAAQPLVANAAESETVETPVSGANEDSTSQDSNASQEISLQSSDNAANEGVADGSNKQADEPKETFGEDKDVEYDPKTETKDPDTGASTIHGEVVNKDEGEPEDGSKPEGETEEEEPTVDDEKRDNTATKTETPDPDGTTEDAPVPKPGGSTTTESKIGVDEDGNTTITTTTKTEGTQTTTTTGIGHADADIKDTKTETDGIDLDEELGKDTKIDWDVKNGTEIDGTKYTVKDVDTTEDGKQTLTLEKTDHQEGEMTAEDIAKLVDAETPTVNEDGSYTLKRTEEVKGEDGKTITRTTYITVKDSHVSIDTTTTLTVTRQKETHTGGDNVDVSEDFTLPEIIIKSDNNAEDKITASQLEELLKKANAPSSTTKGTYTVTEGNREYTITVDRDAAANLSNDEIVAKLGSDYKVEDGKIYYVGNGQHAELTVTQTNDIREKLSYTVEVKETKKGDTTYVKDGDATSKDSAESAATAEAKENAVRNALNAAVDKMLADGDIDETEAKELKTKIASEKIDGSVDGKFEATTANGRKFTLNYKGGFNISSTDIDQSERNDDKTTDNKDYVVKGDSYVTSGEIHWTTDGEDSGTYSESSGDKWEIPAGAVAGEPVTSEDGKTVTTIYTVTSEDGTTTTTYTVTEETVELTDSEKEAIAWKKLADKLGRKDATREELEKEGYSISDVSVTGSTKKVSWTVKQTVTTPEEKDDTGSCREISLNDTIQKKENGKYSILIDGQYQDGFESTDGKIFTKKDGNTTITVTAEEGAKLDEPQIRDLLSKKYDLDSSVVLDIDVANSTASYTDAKGVKHTFYYKDAVTQNISVKKETSSSINKTTEDELLSAVNEALKGLGAGDQLKMSGKETYIITKNQDGTYTITGGDLKDTILEAAKVEATVTEIVKKIASNYINYGSLSGKDIWELLDIQQQYADGGVNNEYVDHKEGQHITDSYWPEDGFQNIHHKGEDGTSYGEIPNQSATRFGHLSLDAEVSIKDDVTGETYDGVLLSDGLTFKYGHKEEVAGYVDMDKYPDKDYNGTKTYDKNKLHTTTTVKTASLKTDITTTTGKVWNGSSYDKVTDKLTYSYTADNSNGFSGKRFYNISGEVAYDKRNNDGFLSEYDATNLLKQLQDEGLDEASMVAVTVNGKTVYNVYAHKTNLNAIGYMTASANTSANQNYGSWTPGCGQAYYGKENAGDYDLRIQGLKLVNGKVQGNYGVNYNLGLTTIRSTTGSDSTLTVNRTTRQTTTDLKGGKGDSTDGTYSYNYTQTHNEKFENWTEADTKGTGTGVFTSFVNLVETLFNGKSEAVTKTNGSFNYSYSYDTISDLQAVDKTTTTVKHAEVNYDYTTVEVKDVDITETEVVVITPDGDNGNEDPVPPVSPELPPVQDATPDAPVVPTDVVLPPVQDATPDAPVLPTDVVLPAVQDARALPQTGVNWLAAIGLALSGFSLMVGGAWASLTGKNAKH